MTVETKWVASAADAIKLIADPNSTGPGHHA
jgi:hypothetical protein